MAINAASTVNASGRMDPGSAACRHDQSSRPPQTPFGQNTSLSSVLGLLVQLIQQLLAQSENGNTDPGGGQPPGQTAGNPLTLSDEQKNALSGYFNDTAPLAYDGLATEFTGNAEGV